MLLFTIAVPVILVASIPVPPAHHGICFPGPFRGITETLDTGEVVGRPDRHDWGCLESDAAGARVRSGQAVKEPAETEGVPSPQPTSVCFGPPAPNPATSATRLRIVLPSATHVELIIYGQNFKRGPFETFEVRSLIDADLMSGVHEVTWNLTDDGGARLEPGIYRAVLTTDGGTLCGDIEVR